MKTTLLRAVLLVSVLSAGSGSAEFPLQTTGSQKMCIINVTLPTGDSAIYAIPAPANWTPASCNAYAQRLSYATHYVLECLFDTSNPAAGSSRGGAVAVGSIAPPPPLNCGW